MVAVNVNTDVEDGMELDNLGDNDSGRKRKISAVAIDTVDNQNNNCKKEGSRQIALNC